MTLEEMVARREAYMAKLRLQDKGGILNGEDNGDGSSGKSDLSP